METDLRRYLPDWFLSLKDYRALMGTETAEFKTLAEAMRRVKADLYIQTCDGETIARYERMLGITADPVAETLDFRRYRVINRMSTQPPFTLRFLYEKLDALIGKGLWSVEVDYPSYTLYIESAAQNQQYAQEVAFTIGRIKPCHIVYRNRPFVRSALRVSEAVGVCERRYCYRLGAWGLGWLPFGMEKDRGVIKLPTEPSVQAALLEQTASFVAEDIQAARVNGSEVITALTKIVEGGTATVSYTVIGPGEITRVELLDGTGSVLTASDVYVPVTDPVVLKHTIPVKEGT